MTSTSSRPTADGRPDVSAGWRSIPTRRDANAPRPVGAGLDRWRGGGMFWPLHAAYWLVVWAACHLLVDIFRPDISEPNAFIASRVAVGFVTTAGLRWIARRAELLRRLGLSKAGAIIGGTVAVAVAVSILQDRIWLAWGGAHVASPPRWLIAMFVVRFAMLAGWAGAYLAAALVIDANRQHERAMEAEAAVRRAELRLLQSQMNPHFLFNALNAVLASREDPQAVERVTQALADYLRSSLRSTRPLEPLGREIDALESFLTVEEARFGDRLACTVECERAARGVLVPAMLVQPLVENALKYGSAEDGGPLRVGVRACVEGERLVVEVTNTGTWRAAPDPTMSHGIGLHGLERRLEMMFPGAAGVSVEETTGWVRVRISIPVGTEGGP